ncbi:MAG: YbbR-like domain-containing protein [Bacteroidetes bacterium]|nr:YbbR-like domain-containing protein [Bacteroidota bacterium]MBU1372338.1 YbbR-like domain-containing protein [Bacteroidota bacterium]MBU1484710.1 YbbR-like domain-containing protein [Bacteroidota bacterium]MBU1762128.1 YbbR-like domain-containing protein [Bacteroidota bacterium]MBU2045219.1 YbbR-like domain-containing protein [Bacteroidota bacterium]
MALIKLSAVERRKLSIFFTCLILAVGAWLFFALSNKYEYQVKAMVNFKNLPQNKAFNPLQSDTVLLDIEGSGWQLLFTKLRFYPKEVKVDLKALERKNFVTFSDQLYSINNSYSSDQKIRSVKPDTLYFDFTTRKVKRVPIRLSNDLNFVNQFGQSAKTILKPDFVTVTGPQEVLDKIKYWDTDTFVVKKIKATILDKVALKKPSEANITIFPANVEIKIPVEQFTEKVLFIPIKVINNKQYLNVKLVPDKVKITFMVSLSDYSIVHEDNFDAVVDLNLWKYDNANQLPVQITKRRAFTRIRRTDPLQVNFMIKR